MHCTYHVAAPITIEGREYRPGDVAAVTDAELEQLDDAGRAALCLPPQAASLSEPADPANADAGRRKG